MQPTSKLPTCLLPPSLTHLLTQLYCRTQFDPTNFSIVMKILNRVPKPLYAFQNQPGQLKILSRRSPLLHAVWLLPPPPSACGCTQYTVPKP